MAGIARNLECPAILINGVEDHVHLLVGLSRTKTTAQLVERLKTDSTKWLSRMTLLGTLPGSPGMRRFRLVQVIGRWYALILLLRKSITGDETSRKSSES